MLNVRPLTAAPAEAEPVLQVHGLCFAHPGQPPLFDDWQARVPAGLTLLQGDIGSGKTTLLHLLAGTWHAGRGSLRLRAAGLHVDADADAAAYRRQACAFDVRDEAFDRLTLTELRDALAARWPARGDACWARHVGGFGLAAHAGKPMAALSTGTRRKAGQAVALSRDCALTLLDEPAAGLDAASVAYLAEALADAAGRDGCAVIVASSTPLPVAAAAVITLAPVVPPG